MNDEEFLRYCEAHSETPRAGFVPANIVRLLELAEPDHEHLDQWRARLTKDPHGIYSFGSDVIYPIVAKARERMNHKEPAQ